MVWKYVNPVVQAGPLTQGQTPALDAKNENMNAVFKVRKYAPDYSGLVGQDLTPKGLIELPGSQTITFGALAGQVFGTAPFTVSATASSGLTVSFSSQTAAVCTVSSATVTLLSVGTCAIQAPQAGSSDWTAATPVNQSFQVTQAPQTITFGALSSQVLGAAPFTISATASSGGLDGELQLSDDNGVHSIGCDCDDALPAGTARSRRRRQAIPTTAPPHRSARASW